jgi:predicted secreted protein
VKRPFFVIFGVLVIGAMVYLAYEYRADLGLAGPRSNRESTNEGQTNPDLRSAHIAWQTVDRTQDGFKVEMPAAASESQVPAYSEQGVAEQVEMIEASVDPDTTYAVAWAGNPPVERVASEETEKTLDMARDGALGRTQTTLLSESKGNHNGYPSRDFSARNAGGGMMNARLILAGTRLYMLIATYPDASARRDEDVKRFFDSFTLTEAPRSN